MAVCLIPGRPGKRGGNIAKPGCAATLILDCLEENDSAEDGDCHNHEEADVMDLEICILAGGLSSRMGRDKSKLRIGRRSLLGHVRHGVRQLGVPVRVIRRDLVPRIGPMGGVYTGLKTTRCGSVLFLSCDMPFVTVSLLRRLLNERGESRQAVFLAVNGRVGFPFLIPTRDLEIVARLMLEKKHSLQDLSWAIENRQVEPRLGEETQLLNINTPADWVTACKFWKMKPE